MQGSRRILVPLSAAVLGALLLPATAAAGALAPEAPVSPGADDARVAYIVMIVVSFALALGVIGALVSALRSGPAEEEDERRTRGTHGIQRSAGLALSAIAIAVFVFGIIVTDSSSDVEPSGDDGLLTAQSNLALPADSEPLEIKVSGQQWLWRYEYPDGTFSYYEMVVPVDTAVVLQLSSVDVNHRWWVPALGGQFDAVPGLENSTWFKADEVGSYEGRSTAFSGPAYATMRARVTVVEPGEYESWLREQASDIQDAQAAVQASIDAGDAPAGASE